VARSPPGITPPVFNFGCGSSVALTKLPAVDAAGLPDIG
jgi:hypothetical protein